MALDTLAANTGSLFHRSYSEIAIVRFWRILNLECLAALISYMVQPRLRFGFVVLLVLC